jgi:membrane peptidoglycan carboxypeptidase
MSENVRIRTRLIVKLAMTVVIAGALFAGVLLPWVGGTGLVARNSASLLHALPGELTDQAPAGDTTVLAADGSLITKFYKNNRTPVPSNKIAPIMKRALVDIEDSRFYEHNGVDVQGTFRALAANVASGSVREGGSTLTQQLVKQTLLQTATSAAERNAATEQNGVQGVSRKLKEARLALALEEKYSKDEILTRYLNIVYFGEGAYGIEAAAQRYFSVSAAALKLPQAAMLAGLVQSPSGDDPLAHPESAAARRNKVLDRMRGLGHITAKEVAAIAPKPVAVKPGGSPPNGCIDATVGGFFCGYLHQYLVNTLHLTQDQLDNGGLTIKTTLRPDLQRAGDQGVLNYASMGNPFAGMLTAVQPGTGHVLAMSVNRRYGCSDPDCESVILNTAASAGSGSTYKVFTAASALSQGFGSGYTIYAPQPYTSKVYKKFGGTTGTPYTVPNDNAGYASTYNMSTALTASSNTYFVALEDALGSVEGPVKTAEAMGMHFDQPNQHPAKWYIDNQIGSFTLGSDATSPLDLASAYSTLAASGTRCDPTPVTKILDRNGQPLTDDKGKPVDTGNHCTPGAVQPGVAHTLSNMLLNVVKDGTGRSAAVPGHDIAGKTGTINDDKSATFVGITPDYAVSVMYFNPKSQQNVGGHGGGIPARMFHDAMAPILAAEPNHPFPPADPAVAAGTRGRGYVPAPPPAPTTPTAPPAPGPNATPPVATPPAAPTTAGGRAGRPPRNGGGDGRGGR